ncbi:MAG: hypothetical protein ABJB55_10375 [Actinomycetota bacterium]
MGDYTRFYLSLALTLSNRASVGVDQEVRTLDAQLAFDDVGWDASG